MACGGLRHCARIHHVYVGRAVSVFEEGSAEVEKAPSTVVPFGGDDDDSDRPSTTGTRPASTRTTLRTGECERVQPLLLRHWPRQACILATVTTAVALISSQVLQYQNKAQEYISICFWPRRRAAACAGCSAGRGARLIRTEARGARHGGRRHPQRGCPGAQRRRQADGHADEGAQCAADSVGGVRSCVCLCLRKGLL